MKTSAEQLEAELRVERLRADLAEARVDLVTLKLLDSQENGAGAWECLEMVRDDLVVWGMDMSGCPPMMYNDALRALVVRVRRASRDAAAKVCDDLAATWDAREIGGVEYSLIEAKSCRDCATALRDDDVFQSALKALEAKP